VPNAAVSFRSLVLDVRHHRVAFGSSIKVSSAFDVREVSPRADAMVKLEL